MAWHCTHEGHHGAGGGARAKGGGVRARERERETYVYKPSIESNFSSYIVVTVEQEIQNRYDF